MPQNIKPVTHTGITADLVRKSKRHISAPSTSGGGGGDFVEMARMGLSAEISGGSQYQSIPQIAVSSTYNCYLPLIWTPYSGLGLIAVSVEGNPSVDLQVDGIVKGYADDGSTFFFTYTAVTIAAGVGGQLTATTLDDISGTYFTNPSGTDVYAGTSYPATGIVTAYAALRVTRTA